MPRSNIRWIFAVSLLVFLLTPALALGSGASDSTPRRPILVTIDDLPIASGRLHRAAGDREKITRGLLEILKTHGIRAVALVRWGAVLSDADRRLLDRWVEAGHELGNHSFDHLDYSETDSATYIADVEKGRAALAAFLDPMGAKFRFFRFPFLAEGDTPEKLDAMRNYLERSGQQNLPVTIDDQDWSFEEPWVTAKRAGDERRLASIGEAYQDALRISTRHHERSGDALFGRALPQILLLHANEIGTVAWDRLFTWLEETGHRFAAADEVLEEPAFSEPHRFVGSFGCSLWDRIRHGRRESEAREQIERLLREQVLAWNHGDLPEFCSVYAEDATFISPSGKTQGREAVLDRYRVKYPDQAAMGKLSLETLEFRPVWGTEISMLGDVVPGDVHGASLVARWSLAYPGKEPASGLTLLVFRRRGDGWMIVQDASM